MKNGKGKLSMEHLIIPDEYVSSLDLHETQIAIKTVKDFFQNLLAERLNLRRVSAPLFVRPESGLNDNLNGVERPVSFDIKESGEMAEVIHSLAKWKRYALDKYGFSVGEGLYTDMVAIRRDARMSTECCARPRNTWPSAMTISRRSCPTIFSSSRPPSWRPSTPERLPRSGST